MLLQDLRYGVRCCSGGRRLRSSRSLTLALGIGTNTAIFTVVDRVILRAVPFRIPIDWWCCGRPTRAAGAGDGGVAADALRLDDAKSIVRGRGRVSLAERHAWRRRAGAGSRRDVTASLLRALAVQPALGRLFLDEEDRPNARPVVLIGDRALAPALWRRPRRARRSCADRRRAARDRRRDAARATPRRRRWCFAACPPADRAELWLPLATDLAGRAARRA